MKRRLSSSVVGHPLQAVFDRKLRIAGKPEVDVDRVTRAVQQRARGRGQHLGEELAAEDPGSEVLDAARFEAIVAERFGVESVWRGLDICARGSPTRSGESRRGRAEHATER
jgi:hypothetical protein